MNSFLWVAVGIAITVAVTFVIVVVYETYAERDEEKKTAARERWRAKAAAIFAQELARVEREAAKTRDDL